jgi:hypothetical protein
VFAKGGGVNAFDSLSEPEVLGRRPPTRPRPPNRVRLRRADVGELQDGARLWVRLDEGEFVVTFENPQPDEAAA